MDKSSNHEGNFITHEKQNKLHSVLGPPNVLEFWQLILRKPRNRNGYDEFFLRSYQPGGRSAGLRRFIREQTERWRRYVRFLVGYGEPFDQLADTGPEIVRVETSFSSKCWN